METKNQDRISELVEKQKDTYTSMADEIWGYAEPRFQEYEGTAGIPCVSRIFNPG